MKTINYKSLMIAIGVLGFVFIVTTLHIVQTDYNTSQQLMSELALGKHGSLMVLGFFSFSIAVFVAQQILAAYKNNSLVRILLVFSSFSLAGAGLFKLDDYTMLHVALVSIAFVLIVMSMCLVPRLIPQFQERNAITVCWALGAGTAVAVALGQSMIPIGIAQRLAAGCILGWLLWLAAFHQKHMSRKTNGLLRTDEIELN